MATKNEHTVTGAQIPFSHSFIGRTSQYKVVFNENACDVVFVTNQCSNTFTLLSLGAPETG